MSDLGFNKIAAAALATGLAILGLRELSDVIYDSHPPEKAGYAIAIQEEAAEGPAVELPPDWGTVLPIANVEAGAEQSKKCISCHTFNAGGANGTGPNQWGVVGRKPGTHAGFAYSTAMVEFGNAHPSWTYDELDAFLKSPQAHLPGTKMTFVGVKNQQDRVNLIAWMRAQADSPTPIPAPKPAAAPALAAAPAPAAAAGEGEQPTVVASGGPSSNAGAQQQAPQSGAAAAPAAAPAH